MRIFGADVDAAVVDPQFYQHGDAYFRGIWAQAGEAPAGQHDLLRALAPHAEGLEVTVLMKAGQLDANAYAVTLDALIRHDVVGCSDGICQYRVELMRRWVEQKGWV